IEMALNPDPHQQLIIKRRSNAQSYTVEPKLAVSGSRKAKRDTHNQWLPKADIHHVYLHRY
ncbi:hypothetical protein K6U19_07885, partial [Vibrio fluvialis]|uniref:hypothetical protein n=1 Tax=Vibrio fluvialis TaxID=676 RepID=UPI001EEA8B4A